MTRAINGNRIFFIFRLPPLLNLDNAIDL
jgi:hypothetical protein